VKLNLGSGPAKLAGWCNVDADASALPDLHADIAHLPFEDESVEEIYASHVLEHFDYREPVLEEWRRVLVPGGQITVIVPDLFGIYVLWKAGIGWAMDKPIDEGYLNAVCFGAQILGAPADAHTHRQIFVGTMLLDRMRPLFPDAMQVDSCIDHETSRGETIVQAHKARRA
jgi:predicted SAM-dependent methyltransferase